MTTKNTISVVQGDSNVFFLGWKHKKSHNLYRGADLNISQGYVLNLWETWEAHGKMTIGSEI